MTDAFFGTRLFVAKSGFARLLHTYLLTVCIAKDKRLFVRSDDDSSDFVRQNLVWCADGREGLAVS